MSFTFTTSEDLDHALASMSRGISRALLDRIALEDRAYRLNPLLQRVDAGHECLIVTRGGQAECVALADLTVDELHALVGCPESAMDLDAVEVA